MPESDAMQQFAGAEHSDWVVLAKRPIAGPEQVIAYFARYTPRIGISNRRILAYDGETVTFSYRDREHSAPWFSPASAPAAPRSHSILDRMAQQPSILG